MCICGVYVICVHKCECVWCVYMGIVCVCMCVCVRTNPWLSSMLCLDVSPH